MVQEVVRIKTFWASVILAIVLPALGQFMYFSNNLARFEERLVNVTSLASDNKVFLSALARDTSDKFLERTDERFRKSDWEKQEVKLEARFTSIQNQILDQNRQTTENLVRLDDSHTKGMLRLEEKLDLLIQEVAKVRG